MNNYQMFQIILNEGVKTTTYKIALLMSIVDYIEQNSKECPSNYLHFIPAVYLAKQFIAYYFPLVMEQVSQGPKSKFKSPTRIRNLLIDFSKQTSKLLSFELKAENINHLVSIIETTKILPEEIIQLLFDIRNIIIDQPLQHIRKVKDENIQIFGLLTNSGNLLENFQEHRIKGKKLQWLSFKASENWQDLLSKEDLFVILNHEAFLEIVRNMGQFREIILEQWVKESTERFGADHPELDKLFHLWRQPL